MVTPNDAGAHHRRNSSGSAHALNTRLGGPWGYAEKLEALADPAHEYHEEALDALGDDHDPHAQPNIDMIHASFAALARKWAPRTRKAK